MENLVVKNWNEYNQEEKETLLGHWWHYYGKMLFTLDEWDQFNKLLKSNIDKIFAVAVAGYLYGMSSQPLICAMREKRVNEFLNLLPSVDDMDLEKKKLYVALENELIAMLVNSYNKPEPNIQMSDEEIIEQVLNIVKK